jgi:hypothetical protein
MSENARKDFFKAVEDAGGEVIHNRTYRNERGRFIPEIRLGNPEKPKAEAERRQRILDAIVAEWDRLHPEGE